MEYLYNPEVRNALEKELPVVALESTVIAHGLPFPRNLDTAHAMEAAIRDEGAVPATIAVLEGSPTIGLTERQLEHVASSGKIDKISVRDLAFAAATCSDGATTVASTMFLANRAGIKVFATGGIGGVHRGDGRDVSADLPVLESTPMTTVCSGAKIVLDLEATREWLETNGVCVLGWRADEFPAFYSRSTGLAVDGRVDSAKEAVRVVRTRDELGIRSAILVTVPIPHNHEIENAVLEKGLAAALSAAGADGIHGKETTPFLLSKLSEFSGGKTVDSNIALLLNNAKVAAQIAVSLHKINLKSVDSES